MLKPRDKPNEEKDLYSKSYKTLKKEIEVNTRRRKDLLFIDGQS
jgi:hypothetical protein